MSDYRCTICGEEFKAECDGEPQWTYCPRAGYDHGDDPTAEKILDAASEQPGGT